MNSSLKQLPIMLIHGRLNFSHVRLLGLFSNFELYPAFSIDLGRLSKLFISSEFRLVGVISQALTLSNWGRGFSYCANSLITLDQSTSVSYWKLKKKNYYPKSWLQRLNFGVNFYPKIMVLPREYVSSFTSGTFKYSLRKLQYNFL